jgi:hypothetical protein
MIAIGKVSHEKLEPIRKATVFIQGYYYWVKNNIPKDVEWAIFKFEPDSQYATYVPIENIQEKESI